MREYLSRTSSKQLTKEVTSDQSINQSINQSIDQSINQLINQSINQKIRSTAARTKCFSVVTGLTLAWDKLRWNCNKIEINFQLYLHWLFKSDNAVLFQTPGPFSGVAGWGEGGSGLPGGTISSRSYQLIPLNFCSHRSPLLHFPTQGRGDHFFKVPLNNLYSPSFFLSHYFPCVLLSLLPFFPNLFLSLLFSFLPFMFTFSLFVSHSPFIWGLWFFDFTFVALSQLMEAFHDIQRLRIEAGPGYALPILMWQKIQNKKINTTQICSKKPFFLNEWINL